MVVQKHCAWVLPCLFPETNPEQTHRYIQSLMFIKNFINYTIFFELLLCSNKVLPVNAEVKLALLFQLRKQLLF